VHEFDAWMEQFARRKQFRNDADYPATRVKGGVRDRAHQSDASTAKDQLDLALSQRLSQDCGQFTADFRN
jgi:hypothetical protein